MTDPASDVGAKSRKEEVKPGILAQWRNYTLLEHVAFGSAADVYLAVENIGQASERLVTLKRVHGNSARNPGLAKFVNEDVRLLTSLRGTNIAQLLEAGSHEGQNYFVFEYVEGLSLRSMQKQMAERREPLPLEVVVELARQTALALATAHSFKNPATAQSHPILHRELSAHNVWLDTNGHVKVLDFGVAKTTPLQSDATYVGSGKKLSYMSPEQFLGKSELDARSDLFSLGVIFWELLAGRRIFSGEGVSRNQSLELFLRGQIDLESIAHVRPDADQMFCRIIDQLLQRNRDLRLHSAAELVTALRDYQKRGGYRSDSDFLKAFVAEKFSDKIIAERTVIEKCLTQARPVAVPANEIRVQRISPVTSGRTPTPLPRATGWDWGVGGFAALCVMATGLHWYSHSHRARELAGAPAVAQVVAATQSTPASLAPVAPAAPPPAEISGLSNDQKRSVKTLRLWLVKMRATEPPRVVRAWRLAFKADEKLNNPEPYLDKFDKLTPSDRQGLLLRMLAFTAEFDKLELPKQKIKLIEEHRNDIELMPPRRP